MLCFGGYSKSKVRSSQGNETDKLLALKFRTFLNRSSPCWLWFYYHIREDGRLSLALGSFQTFTLLAIFYGIFPRFPVSSIKSTVSVA